MTKKAKQFDPNCHYTENGKVFCKLHEEEVHWIKYTKSYAKTIGRDGGWVGCRFCNMPDEAPPSSPPDGFNSEFYN